MQASLGDGAPRIRLRTDQFEKYSRLRRLRTNEAQAHFIGINPGTLSRVTRGICPPGGVFVAAALATFKVRFETLFEVVVGDEDGEQDGLAA